MPSEAVAMDQEQSNPSQDVVRLKENFKKGFEGK